MKKSINEILENLEGNWELERSIYNIDTNITDTAQGKASFSKIDNDESNILNYQESGELTLQKNKIKLNFQRQYIYQLNGERIDIILNDGVTKGQLFQTLTLQEDEKNLIGSEHICRLDKHNGKHFFTDEFSFFTEYTINGPKTNLLIKTYYKKVRN